MVRANKQGVVDVGPRSAHIAGLDYAVFTDTDKIRGPKVEFFSPKQGDPDDYVRIRMEDGSAVTLTNSCAANVLGLVKPEHFSYGNVESARKAMKAWLTTAVQRWRTLQSKLWKRRMPRLSR